MNVPQLAQEISDIDQKVTILLAQRKELEKRKNSQLPNAFDVMKKNSKKRTVDIREDQTGKMLVEMLSKDSTRKIQSTTSSRQNKDAAEIVIGTDKLDIEMDLDNYRRARENDDANSTESIEEFKPALKVCRKTYTDEVKRVAVKTLEKFTYKQIRRQTGIPKANLVRWRREEKIGFLRMPRGRRVTYPFIEDYLFKWVYQERAKKSHLSVRRLMIEARSEAKKKNYDKVQFSWGWVFKFLGRNKLKLKKPMTRIPKDPSQLEENMRVFKQKLKVTLDTGLYPDDFILNMDETGVPTEGISTKTITHAEEDVNDGAKTHTAVRSSNKDKESTSVALACSWSGVKLRALVILEGNGTKKLKTLIPENIYVAYRPEGSYMDREVMRKWATYVLRPYSRGLPESKRGLILIDGFKGHISEEIELYLKQECRFDVLKFPSNLTGKLQPLDISVNRPFKAFCAHRWENYIASLDVNSKRDVTSTGNFKAPSRETKLDWIFWAWTQISTATASNGFNIYKRYMEESSLNPVPSQGQDPTISNSILSMRFDNAVVGLDEQLSPQNQTETNENVYNNDENQNEDVTLRNQEASEEDKELLAIMGDRPVDSIFLDYMIEHQESL